MSRARRRERQHREAEDASRTARASWLPQRDPWEIVAEVYVPDGDNDRGRREIAARFPILRTLHPNDVRWEISCARTPDGRPVSSIRVSRRRRDA